MKKICCIVDWFLLYCVLWGHPWNDDNGGEFGLLLIRKVNVGDVNGFFYICCSTWEDLQNYMIVMRPKLSLVIVTEERKTILMTWKLGRFTWIASTFLEKINLESRKMKITMNNPKVNFSTANYPQTSSIIQIYSIFKKRISSSLTINHYNTRIQRKIDLLTFKIESQQIINSIQLL